MTWKRHIVFAVVIAFVLRLCLVFLTRDIRIVADGKLQIWGDAYFYHHSANLVAEGVGFVNPLKYNKFGLVMQAADHPPLFIVYLSLFSLVGLGSIAAHQLATGLIGVALVVAIGALAREMFGQRIAIVTLWLAVASPLLWSWDKMLWSEPLAMLFAVLTILAAVRTLRDPSLLNVLFLGASAGLATLSRAELLLCGILCISVVLVFHHRAKVKAAVAITCLIGFLSPWVAFNLNRFDETVLLSNGLDIVIPTDNCESTYSGPLVAYWDIECAQNAIDRAEGAFPNSDESVVNAEIRRIGVEFIKENKRRAIEVAVLRELRIIGVYKPLQQIRLDHFPEGKDRNLAVLSWMNYYAILPFALAGILMTYRRSRVTALVSSTPIFTALLAVAISAGITRYRAIADPMLIMFAAFALVNIFDFFLRQWKATTSNE
ncbi:MAG: glycosyltransferase family 39 protein [Ilumatobacteraceae bacterium]|jgi:hypothetical protein|nr:glycosyltransferase family 39 protein [Ilumatobacteraceae bacterium]